jgi:hypothetical protein
MDPMIPAVSLEDSAIARLNEARAAIARIAGGDSDPKSFRGAIAADVAEALRALELARHEIRRFGEVSNAKKARVILNAQVTQIIANTATSAPEVMVVVIPLPIDGTRISLEMPLDRFSETVNRLALDVQRRDRRYATWLISAPSYSGARRSREYDEDRQHIEFTVQYDETVLASMRFYGNGAIIFRRQLHRAKRPGFALREVESDLNATLLFVRELFLDLGASPIQVAVALVRHNAGDFIMARPSTFGGSEFLAPRSADVTRVYPTVPALSGYSAFSDQPLALSTKVLRALESDYEPEDSDNA